MKSLKTRECPDFQKRLKGTFFGVYFYPNPTYGINLFLGINRVTSKSGVCVSFLLMPLSGLD
jgi:hypothetical protein